MIKLYSISRFIKKGRRGASAKNRGKVSVRGRGGGTFKKFRVIDRYRSLWNIPAFIISFDYNPIHRFCLALVSYFVGIISYVTAVSNLKVGKVIVSSRSSKLKYGNATFLKSIPRNLKISLVEIRPGGGFTLLRSSGSNGVIKKKSKFFSFLKLPSKKIIKLSNFCYCTIGKVSLIKYKFNSRKRAGLTRLSGFRPIVRGVAMNPIDHPHGGGVGKKSKKSVKMSPWGRLQYNKRNKL